MTTGCLSKRTYSKLALFSVLILLLMAGCHGNVSSSIPLVKDFYDSPKNWACLDSSIPIFASDYDVFFVYPTQIQKAAGLYFNWLSGNQGHEVHNYVAYHTQKQFGSRVRVFSPFVPQIDFEQYTQLLYANREIISNYYFTNSPLNVSIRFTVSALQYYMANYHKSKRPFFLIGYEQGAVILYEALRQYPELNLDNGLIAAYFFGLPGITPERILKDFKKNKLTPAKGRLDLGVIAVFNTRMPDTPIEETYSTPGGYVINPLNWSTENTNCSFQQNAGAVFYKKDAEFLKNRYEESPYFCGADLDLDNALINIHLPPLSDPNRLEERERLLKTLVMSEKSLFSNAWGMFGRNIVNNTIERTQKYLFIQQVLKPSDQQEN